jgi:hypothetical protein
MLAAAALSCAVLLTIAVPVRADDVAYLVNVTVRPGYAFANAADALAYGRGICDDLSGGGASYSDIMARVKSDFDNADEYQASYLVTQAVNELCPAMIWQLRRSAAAYRPAVH